MKSKNITITISGFILFFFLFAGISFAEIKKVEVGIDGLSCPFCVWGLKQQMKGIKSIEKLEISLKKSLAHFTLKEDSLLNIEEIEGAVKDAGFSIRGIGIEAAGEITAYDGFPALKVSGSGQIFILSNFKKINPGAAVLIDGSVHKHEKGKSYGLLIKKLKIIEDSL